LGRGESSIYAAAHSGALKGARESVSPLKPANMTK